MYIVTLNAKKEAFHEGLPVKDYFIFTIPSETLETAIFLAKDTVPRISPYSKDMFEVGSTRQYLPEEDVYKISQLFIDLYHENPIISIESKELVESIFTGSVFHYQTLDLAPEMATLMFFIESDPVPERVVLKRFNLTQQEFLNSWGIFRSWEEAAKYYFEGVGDY